MSFPNMPTNAGLYGVATPTAGVASGLISALSGGSSNIGLYTTFMNASKKATKDKTGIRGMTDMVKSVARIPFGIGGVIMDFMQALGVAEPILDIITMLIEMLGAAIMVKMMPAFMKLFDTITESGLIDLIIIIGGLIGDVLGVVFTAIAIALEKLNPLFEILSDILGSAGMQEVIIILAKVLGTIIMLGFIPLIMIIYAVGTAIAALMDIFMEIITLTTHEDWKFSKAWQEGLGGSLLEATGSIIEGIGELWAMDFAEDKDEEDKGGDTNIFHINVEEPMDADNLFDEIDRRKLIGR